jgi:hypothetical protein
MDAKRHAYEFLASVQDRLNWELPGSQQLQDQIETIRANAKGDPSQKHFRGRELAFTNAIVTPILFDVLSCYPDMTSEKAKKAFLSESYQSLKGYCSGSPARRLRHPFNKGLNAKAESIYAQWRGTTGRTPLTQSCPDFAFRDPFPHHIVFESKYFTGASPRTAQRELVTDVYQAFFYRALPTDSTKTNRPDWQYDYSCLLAYDASLDSLLVEAWEQLSPEVRRGFWDGANVYVMILRGNTKGGEVPVGGNRDSEHSQK